MDIRILLFITHQKGEMAFAKNHLMICLVQHDFLTTGTKWPLWTTQINLGAPSI